MQTVKILLMSMVWKLAELTKPNFVMRFFLKIIKMSTTPTLHFLHLAELEFLVCWSLDLSILSKLTSFDKGFGMFTHAVLWCLMLPPLTTAFVSIPGIIRRCS